MSVNCVYFSPGGTTEAIAKQIAGNIGKTYATIDLLKDKITEEKQFNEDDILVAAMPVFAGRIPNVCVDMLKKLKGSNTPAIAVAVYGNRAYEDALLELSDLLSENGFVVAGAAAVLARHSIFPEVAAGRPDRSDIDKIDEFTGRCISVMESKNIGAIKVPGNKPYREASPVPLFPSVNSKCNECGACVKICPTGAISENDIRLTDKEKCISCTACIYVCPKKARKYKGLKYMLGSKMFKKKCSVRLEPEFFTADIN